MVVYKDPQRGTYYFITRVQQPDGSTKQVKRRGFETKKAAKIAESELLQQKIESKNQFSFEAVAIDYMEWYSKRRKQSSITKINGVLKGHLIPKFGHMELETIRPIHIMDYHTELIEKGYSASHVTKIHTILSATFNFAIKREQIKENPARLAGNADLKIKKRVDYWVLDEFKEFIKHVDELVYYAMFMLLYYSGLRKGEMLALTWSDIDFKTNMINVNKTEYNRIVTTPKTEASNRQLLIPTHVMDLLQQLKNETNPKSSYVVFGEFHDSIPTSSIDRKFEYYVKQSGVKKIRIHDFRHSHASYLINKGTIISVVAKRLGHEKPATTLNTYSHLFPSTENEAVLSMEDDFKTAKILKMLP